MWRRQPTSESRTACPFCSRAVGGIHYEDCPRSRASLAAIRLEGARRMTPRIVWAKGRISIVNTATGDRRELYNPGVPYVRPGREPYVGGKPRGEAAAVKAFHEDALSILRPVKESSDG